VEEIVTGEAVVLDLPCARFPTRILARLIDMFLEIAALGVIAILAAVGDATRSLNSASTAAVLVAGFVLVIVGYPVTFETLSRGRTLGKLALGLRVVTDDGGPERFRQALVRALAGAIECWALIGVPALITSMLSARGKRLGDIFAGTFVLLERTPRPAVLYQVPLHQAGPYPAGFGAGGPPHPAAVPLDPGLRPWAASLDLSGLPDPLAASAASYLSRYWQLNEAARDHLGWQLAADIAARVSPPPPPGLPPAAYLHTVLAERRNRELARLMSAGSPAAPASLTAPARVQPTAPPPTATPPAATPPAATPQPKVPEDTGFTPPE
jgi:uncharacterized RDD family membrane protein YckC